MFNLKMIMIQLNNECHKIKLESLSLLKEFFVDIDSRIEKIKTLILTNKENFYTLFELNSVVFDSVESTEIKNFILYELERIDN